MNLNNILLSDDVKKSINDNLEYLLKIIPEIKKMIGFNQKHPHHHLDLWNHTLCALELSKKDFDIRLCLLLHDIGKVDHYIEGEDGVRHYPNHGLYSSEISKTILKRLGFDESYIDYICDLIKHHDITITDEEIINDYDKMKTLYEIQKCDAFAHHPDMLEKRKKYLDCIKEKLSLKEKQIPK